MVFSGCCITGTLVVGLLLFWVGRLFPAAHRTLAGVVTGVLFVFYFWLFCWGSRESWDGAAGHRYPPSRFPARTDYDSRFSEG